MENNAANSSLIDHFTNLLMQEAMRHINPAQSVNPTPVHEPNEIPREPPVNEPNEIPQETSGVHDRDDNFNRLLDTVYDVIHGYNNIMQGYNANISSMLQYINQTQYIINRDASPRSSQNGFTGPHGVTGPTQPTVRTSRSNRTIYSSPMATTARMNQIFPSQSSATTPSDNTLDQALIFTYLFEPLFQEPEQNENQRPMTREEISTMTRTFSYVRDSLPEDRRICPIGMDTFLPGDVLCEIRGCGHIFRRPPLMNWLRRSSRCPVCRYHIRTYQSPSTPPSHNILPVRPVSPIRRELEDEAPDSVEAVSDSSDIDMDMEVD